MIGQVFTFCMNNQRDGPEVEARAKVLKTSMIRSEALIWNAVTLYLNILNKNSNVYIGLSTFKTSLG